MSTYRHDSLARSCARWARGGVLLFLWLAAVLAPAVALAQEAENESVKGRARPAFDPIGIELDQLLKLPAALIEGRNFQPALGGDNPLSSFIVRPAFDFGIEITDNLFRTGGAAVSDTIYLFEPSFDIVSDWENHSLSFRGSASIGRHVSISAEDFEDIEFGASGRLDVTEFGSVSSSLSIARKHEERGSIDDLGPGVGQTNMVIASATLSALYMAPVGLDITPTYTVTRTSFNNPAGVDNTDRDRIEHLLKLRLAYEFQPQTEIFVEGAETLTRFDRKFDDNGERRDSDLTSLSAGITWDVSPITSAEFSVGYLTESFAEPGFKKINSFIVNGSALWNATPVVSLTGSVSRTVKTTTVPDVSGIVTTDLNLGVDWDPAENLIVSAEYGLSRENFAGASPAMRQTTNRFGLSAKLLISLNLYTEVGITYEVRDSTDPGERFDATTAMLRFGVQI